MSRTRIRAVVVGITRAVFVDAVVGEMHEAIAEVVDVIVVLDGRETHEAVRVHVDLERIEASDEHVET